MFSMGLGALAAEEKYTKHPINTLLSVEILLTLIGGFSLGILHVLNMLYLPRIVFSAAAHILIICIGVLTGFEVPLFFEIVRIKKISSENIVLGVNYFGAFVGTGCFTFVFYPIAGLMATSFFVGFINALAGTSLMILRGLISKEALKPFYRLWTLQVMILVMIGICLFCSDPINEYFMDRYMNAF